MRIYVHSSWWQRHVCLAEAGRIPSWLCKEPVCRVSCGVRRSCVVVITQERACSSSLGQLAVPNATSYLIMCIRPALCRITSATEVATDDSHQILMSGQRCSPNESCKYAAPSTSSMLPSDALRSFMKLKQAPQDRSASTSTVIGRSLHGLVIALRRD